MTNILIIISSLVFYSYVIFIWNKYGAQKSISQSFYCLQSKYRWLFTLFVFSFTVPLIFLTDDKVLMPVAIWLVALVGAASNFTGSIITKYIHMIGAIGGILLANISLILEFDALNLVLVNNLIIVISCSNIPRKNLIWGIEILQFTHILIILWL
jgi:hypothetical protein